MRKGIFGIALICILMFTGCTITYNTDIQDITVPITDMADTGQAELTPSDNKTSTDNSSIDAITDEPVYNVDMNREINIYTVDYDTLEKEAVLTVVPAEQELTPSELLDIVVDTLVDNSFTISIDTVVTQDDIVIVSFPKEGEPVHGLFARAEDAILDAIAQSLLDNFDEYHKIVFRCEMKEYQSDNHTFSLDYIYMED